MSKIFEALQRSESERSELALIERANSAADFLKSAESDVALHEYRQLIPAVLPESRLVCISDPTSLAAEKFRVLSVRLRNMAMKRALKRILITSALPGEGKSVCAANLAISLSRNNHKKTLLIEGDLRRPGIARALRLPAVSGLSEWLHGDMDLTEAIYRLDPPGCWFLPAGATTDNPLELMQPGKLNQLFEQVSAIFDWIIVDSTPMVPLADTVLWSRYADGVLLITREGITQKRPLLRAIETLKTSPLLGVVLNGCTSHDDDSYYHYYPPIQPNSRSGILQF